MSPPTNQNNISNPLKSDGRPAGIWANARLKLFRPTFVSSNRVAGDGICKRFAKSEIGTALSTGRTRLKVSNERHVDRPL